MQNSKPHFWPLERGNHKGNGVEKFHRFLNKTSKIQENDHGTHNGIAHTVKTSRFAWNSAHIDGTDIDRSVAAIGRKFKFPLDIELGLLPTLNDDSNSALTDYLRNVSN